MKEILEMSEKERDRLVLLRQVQKGCLSQVKAAELLHLTDRQVRNLLKSLETEGDRGLISKKRGAPSNNRISKKVKQQVLDLLTTYYEGYGPTLAAEKLAEENQIHVSKETLRNWMIEAGLWKAKQEKCKLHLPRARRECFGELIQMDGSHDYWLGPNHDRVVLNVMIDDATSRLTSLHLSLEEDLPAYYAVLARHLEAHGRPRAIYTDRSAIAEVRQGDGQTQFHQSLEKLDIELILANSPQAKGRVERANRTLQDRLIKELRLRGINTLEKANEFLPEFVEKYNKKFSREPMNLIDVHRPLEGHDLSAIFSQQKVRILRSSCIFQFDNQFFQVQGLAQTRRNKGRKVHLAIGLDHSLRAFIDGIERPIISVEGLDTPVKPEVKGRKSVSTSKKHPWRCWNPNYLGAKNNKPKVA